MAFRGRDALGWVPLGAKVCFMPSSKKLRQKSEVQSLSKGRSRQSGVATVDDDESPSASASKSRRSAGASAQDKLAELTGNFRFKDVFPPPADPESSLRAVKKDMSEVPVLGAD